MSWTQKILSADPFNAVDDGYREEIIKGAFSFLYKRPEKLKSIGWRAIKF